MIVAHEDAGSMKEEGEFLFGPVGEKIPLMEELVPLTSTMIGGVASRIRSQERLLARTPHNQKTSTKCVWMRKQDTREILFWVCKCAYIKWSIECTS